ncbi:DKNYY domain-containing protein [Patescibacteria group bacterium]|nr:DKNYY domain-containing protein [Patescibacteria group bacterium]
MNSSLMSFFNTLTSFVTGSSVLASVSEAEGMSDANIMGTIILIFLATVLLVLALIAIVKVGQWKMFKKAGIPGWAALVPYYDITKMLEMGKKPFWWSFMMLIPVVNIFFGVKLLRRTAAVFGRGAWFTVGMIFLPFIFFPILGFGKSKYNPDSVSDDITPLSEAGKYALITAAFATIFMLLSMSPSSYTPHRLSIIHDAYGEESGYATDGHYVYQYDHVVPGADADTFEVTGYYYAKDLFSVYYDGKKMKNADSDTFEELGDGYAKDAKHVYYSGDILEGADAATFERSESSEEGALGRDAMGVYYYGEKIEDADPETFVTLPFGYQKDATRVYYDGALIGGADAATFTPLAEPTQSSDAKDKNHSYLYGKVVK